MTYNQLKKDVFRLGFETVIEDENLLLGAANSALDLIYIDRPRVKTARLFVKAVDFDLYSDYIYVKGSPISFSLTGDAYSFTAVGRGKYTIENGGEKTSKSITLGDLTHSGRIDSACRITFESEGGLAIYNLATVKELAQDLEIPLYSRLREIDPTGGEGDFRSFCRFPYYEDGSEVKGVMQKGEKLFLPADFEGEIFLDYYRAPTHITADNPEESIDISEEVAPLLPLLTASYLWLDDDSEKAQYYMALYRQSLATIMRYSLRSLDSKYKTNGWA